MNYKRVSEIYYSIRSSLDVQYISMKVSRNKPQSIGSRLNTVLLFYSFMSHDYTYSVRNEYKYPLKYYTLINTDVAIVKSQLWNLIAFYGDKYFNEIWCWNTYSLFQSKSLNIYNLNYIDLLWSILQKSNIIYFSNQQQRSNSYYTYYNN